MSLAAILAHATRLIRTLEAFQLMHVLYHQHRYTTLLDEDYQCLLVPPQTEGPLLPEVVREYSRSATSSASLPPPVRSESVAKPPVVVTVASQILTPTEPNVTQGVTKKPAAAKEQPKVGKNAALWMPTEDVSPRRLTAASSVDPSLGKENTSESSGDSNATVAPTASKALNVVTKFAKTSDPTLADFRRSISS
ncbi:hypothetical protein RB195_009050 [Necator americanus]